MARLSVLELWSQFLSILRLNCASIPLTLKLSALQALRKQRPASRNANKLNVSAVC